MPGSTTTTAIATRRATALATAAATAVTDISTDIVTTATDSAHADRWRCPYPCPCQHCWDADDGCLRVNGAQGTGPGAEEVDECHGLLPIQLADAVSVCEHVFEHSLRDSFKLLYHADANLRRVRAPTAAPASTRLGRHKGPRIDIFSTVPGSLVHAQQQPLRDIEDEDCGGTPTQVAHMLQMHAGQADKAEIHHLLVGVLGTHEHHTIPEVPEHLLAVKRVQRTHGNEPGRGRRRRRDH